MWAKLSNVIFRQKLKLSVDMEKQDIIKETKKQPKSTLLYYSKFARFHLLNFIELFSLQF